MAYVDFLSTVHKSTKRDYVARVTEFPKAEAARLAKKWDVEYWDGDRKTGYGGYRYDGRWRKVADAMVQHYGIKPGDRILDVGCGKGFILYDFTQAVPGVEVVGIDVSTYAIEHAKEEVKPLLQVASAAQLPFPDQSFDLVISINTLHNLYCYDLHKALKEIVRVGPQTPVSLRRVVSHRGGKGQSHVLAVHLRDVLHAAGVAVVVRPDRLHAATIRSFISSNSYEISRRNPGPAEGPAGPGGYRSAPAGHGPGPGQVLFSGICGSQIGEIDGVKGPDRFLPHLLGHEGTGIVLEVGEGVRTVKPDDKVVLHWRKGSGLESVAPSTSPQIGRVNAGWVTTFNEYAIVSENRVTAIPRDFDADVAALFGCAVTTGFGVINNNAQLKIGQSIAIFGAGGIGLNIVQAAALVSANPIIAVDLFDNRLALARSLGATHLINSSEQDAEAEIRKIVGPQGVDVAVDNTGNVKVIETAYRLTGAAGADRAGRRAAQGKRRRHLHACRCTSKRRSPARTAAKPCPSTTFPITSALLRRASCN